MIPILYESTEKNFTTNGLGRLKDAISCYVIEERNGSYELEMDYPVNGIHYSDLKVDRIIYAMPADGKDPQPFRIYKISRPLSGQVSVSAEHISYLLSTAVVMPFTASSCTATMAYLDSNIVGADSFTFWTDKEVTGTFKLEKPTEARTVLGGTSGSILDTYGTGEYEFDKFTVKLHLHRGEDRGVTIRYGKNLADLTAEQDITNVYTGIVPYASNQDDDGNEVSVVLPEKVIKSEHTGDYAYPLYKVVDFSSQNQDGDEGTLSVDELRSLAEKYVKDNDGWEITDSLTVSFVALWQTDEYKNIAPLERVSLCDTVHVIYTDLGVNVKAKVTKTDFDVLNERYNSIELGEASNNLSKTLNEAINKSNTALSDKVSALPAAIKRATNLITGGLGGYVVIKTNANGQPEELLIMDTDDIDTATKVWRWNQNGLGYSSTGYNGTYGLAMTKDGEIVADFITTGTLDASLIKTGTISNQDGTININLDKADIEFANSDGDTCMITGPTLLLRNGSTGAYTYITLDSIGFYTSSGVIRGYYGANQLRFGTKVSHGDTAGGKGILIDENYLTVGNNSEWSNVPVMKVGAADNGYNYVQVSSLRFYRSDGGSAGAMEWDSDEGSRWVNLNTNFHCDGHVKCNDVIETGSDERIKQDIEPIPIGESERLIMGIAPKRYRYKASPEKTHHGFIAQNVLENLSDDSIVRQGGDGMYSLAYSEFIADLVNVVQDQNMRIKALEERLYAEH